MRSLPISTEIAGTHLFIDPDGSREVHWRDSAEWAYVVDKNFVFENLTILRILFLR
jgi:hypothetical protein